MADKRVTDLTLLSSADATDIIPVVDVSANTTKKTTVAGLSAAVASSLPAGSVAASKIDFTTITVAETVATTDFLSTSGSTYSEYTALATTFTADGTSTYKVTLDVFALYASSIGISIIGIFDGAVSGTAIQEAQVSSPAANAGSAVRRSVKFIPTAGSHTIRVGIRATAGNANVGGSAVRKNYLTVEKVKN